MEYKEFKALWVLKAVSVRKVSKAHRVYEVFRV
jgi:hypothetical protein